MATKKELLNVEVDLTPLRQKEGGLTVKTLKGLLAMYPDDAKVEVQNFNEGTIPTAGITAITGGNAIKNDNDRSIMMSKTGRINTVVLGLWHEGRYDAQWPE